MIRLESLLQPGEAVLARRTSSAGRYFLFMLAVYVLAFALMLGIGEFLPEGAERWRGPWPLIAFTGPLPFFIPWLLWLDGGGRPAALVLTDRRLLMRQGIWPGRIRQLDREQIASVVLFEASKVLHLALVDGRIERISDILDADSFVRVLGVPGRIWRRRLAEAENAPLKSRVAWIQFVVQFVILISLQLIFLFADVFGIPGTPIWVGPVLASICLVAIVAIPVLTCAVIMAHYLIPRGGSPEDRRRIACLLLSPLCQGREPYPAVGGNLLDRYVRALDRWIVARFHNGRLDCDCQPDIVGTASP